MADEFFYKKYELFLIKNARTSRAAAVGQKKENCLQPNIDQYRAVTSITKGKRRNIRMEKVRYYHKGTSVRHATALLCTGLAAGVINGLLGTGGGIIVVLVLTAWYKRLCKNSDERHDVAKSVYVTSLLTMLPVSLFSALQYAKQGRLAPAAFAPYLLPALLGGLVGGVVLDRVRLPFLQKLFALLLLVSGVRMVMR